MRLVRNLLLGASLVALAAACGGKNKNDSTMENSGGNDTAGGGDEGMGGMGYGGMDPCNGGGSMDSGSGMDPCEGGE